MLQGEGAAHADRRPVLDDVSAWVLTTERPSDWQDRSIGLPQPRHSDDTPAAPVWAALSLAPGQGVAVTELTQGATGQPWVYLRLRELTSRGQAKAPA